MKQQHSPRLVLDVPRDSDTSREVSPLASRWSHAVTIVSAAALLLLVVTWTHLALIWIPPRLGNAPWEFAALTQSVDIFPLGIMGLTILGVVSVLRSWSKRGVALATWSFVSAAFLVGVAVLLLLDLPVAWASVTPQLRAGVMRTGGKALLFALLFVAYHAWLGARLLRTRRPGT